MWNILAKIASKENDYIYILGDDSQFITKGWEQKFITLLL